MKNWGVEIIKNWWGNGNILIFWPKLGRKHYLFRGWKKFSHVNKNSCEYEKILSSLNKNFRESEKILASLKKFLRVWKNSRMREKILARLRKSLASGKKFMSRKNSSESMLSWCYDFDGCHKWYVNKNCHIFFKKNEDWKI